MVAFSLSLVFTFVSPHLRLETAAWLHRFATFNEAHVCVANCQGVVAGRVGEDGIWGREHSFHLWKWKHSIGTTKMLITCGSGLHFLSRLSLVGATPIASSLYQ